MKNFSLQRGFTLIELLVVTSIIAALALVVFTSLNPPQRIREANDSRRRNDVDSYVVAVHQFIVDNDGALPLGMSAGMAEVQIGTDTSGCAIATGGCAATGGACLDITAALSPYLKTLPLDPVSGTVGKTNYTIAVDTNNIVTARACGVEAATEVQSSR